MGASAVSVFFHIPADKVFSSFEQSGFITMLLDTLRQFPEMDLDFYIGMVDGLPEKTAGARWELPPFLCFFMLFLHLRKAFFYLCKNCFIFFFLRAFFLNHVLRSLCYKPKNCSCISRIQKKAS